MSDIVWKDAFSGPRTGDFADYHRQLSLTEIPDDNTPWFAGRDRMDKPVAYPSLAHFAMSFDGYAAVAERNSVGSIHGEVLAAWKETGDLTGIELVELRIALFFIQMRNIHVGDEPDGDWDHLGRAIVSEIRNRLRQLESTKSESDHEEESVEPKPKAGRVGLASSRKVTGFQFTVFIITAVVVTGLIVGLLGNNEAGNFLGPVVGIFVGLWVAAKIAGS